MSSPYPTAREFTFQDLDLYLKGLEKKIIHYKAEQQVRPSEYNLEQLKKLDLLVINALDQYHNQ